MKRHNKEYEAPLFNVQNVEFTIDISFGKSETAMTLPIDSGSADLWVYTQNCNGCADGIQTYDCQSSNTCKKTDIEVDILYDDGPIKGHVSFEQVTIGEKNDSHEPVILSDQAFLYVYQAEEAMKNTPGLFGIGPPTLSENPYPQPIQSMLEKGFIQEYQFSMYLSTENYSETSRFMIGGVDKSFISSGHELVYADIISSYMYLVEIQGFNFNNKFVSTNQALIDSGTSCLTFPVVYAKKILKQFEKVGISCQYDEESYAPQYAMTNCIGKLEDFPNLDIVIKDQKLTFKPEDYIYKCYKYDEKQHYCMTKIERSQQDNFIILGAAFIERFYTVFDLTDRKIGFARNINENDLESLADNEEENLQEKIMLNHTLSRNNYLWKYDLLIASIVLLSLGFCTAYVLHNLKNKKQITKVLTAKSEKKEQQQQQLPKKSQRFRLVTN